MKRLTLALILLVAACAAAGGQTAAGDSAEGRQKDIRRLLELMRSAELGRQAIQQGVDEVRKSLSFLTDEQRERVVKVYEEEMLKEFSEEKFVAAYAPIYEKNLTAEEVKGLIDFYQSPLGKKLVEAQPAIMREAYDDGVRRGREAWLRTMARVTGEGILLSPSSPDPPPRPAPRRGKRTTRRRSN